MSITGERALRAGMTLRGGRYLLVAPLGRGGFATVWRARDTRARGKNNADVAIKLLTAEDGGAEAAAREAEVTARVRHANVVAVRDTFSEDGAHAIVMELGLGSLAELMEEQGPLAPGVALDAVLQACAGLAAAHEAGVVHRDVKPENLLVFPGGVVKLGDFGVARAEGHTRTRTANVLGSIPFMAPEQRRDPRAVRPATDVYAMAVTLAWLVTGRAPGDLFAPGALAELVEAGVPVGIAEGLVRAGAHDARERPKDAGALAEVLRGCGLVPEPLAGAGALRWGVDREPLAGENHGAGGSTPRNAPRERAGGGGRVPRAWWIGGLGVGMGIAVVLFIRTAEQPPRTEVAVETLPRCDTLPTDFNEVNAVGPREVMDAAFDDVNLDGVDDLLVTSQLDEVVWIYPGGQAPTLRDPEVVHVGRSGLAAHPVDVDRDGRMEVLVAERDAARWAAYTRGTAAAKLVASWPQGTAALHAWDLVRTGVSTVTLLFPSPNDNCVLSRSLVGGQLGPATCAWRTYRSLPASVSVRGPRATVAMVDGMASVLDIRSDGWFEVDSFGAGRAWIAPDTRVVRTLSRGEGVVTAREEHGATCMGGTLPQQPNDVGDWNGDGRPDYALVASCRGCTSELRVFMGRETPAN